ncbi:MAG TPA: hypothetical protein VKF82_07565 [Candidatus Eremiobacteraceae bacterium]|nr:hypothetical protein [Candidatus Eremiobacteraceae bacterium]
MPHPSLCGLRVAPLIILALCAPAFGASASSAAFSPAVPPVLARLRGFHGHIEYAGHRSDVPHAPEIQGSAQIGADGFSVDEHSARYAVHADRNGVEIQAGSVRAWASDPLASDVLVNPWLVALARLSAGGLRERSALSWEAPRDVVVYVDRVGDAITGIAPAHDARLAYVFAGWSEVSGVPVPTRIVRLRSGIQDATFQIDRLDIALESAPAARDTTVSSPVRSAGDVSAPVVPAGASGAVSAPFPWSRVLGAFGLMALAVAIVAWLRRDAFSMRLCDRATRDPRGWKAIASAAYVGPDGVLTLEGNHYRVGPEFFARAVEVQHSALFVRVSAPGVSRAMVLPRRLPRIAARPERARRATAGLSLIETLVSMAFFTTVIVAAVYPALTAVARADYVAAQKRAALLAVSNALTDEETACAYGTVLPTGTTSSSAGDLTITVVVSANALADARDVAVSASDSSGRVLAKLATTVGPPVPPPGSSTTPPAGPAPPAPPTGGSGIPTPTPTPTPAWSALGGR